MTDAAQTTRRQHLRELMDSYRCWPSIEPQGAKYADYDCAYRELMEYVGPGDPSRMDEWVADYGPLPPVPRYAAMIHDETYTMIMVSDDLNAALAYSAGNPDGDTLTGQGDVIDLDSGAPVEKRTLVLSAEQLQLLDRALSDAASYRRPATATADAGAGADGPQDGQLADEYTRLRKTIIGR